MLSFFKGIKQSFKLKHYINYIIVIVALVACSLLYYSGSLNRTLPSLFNQIGYSIILAVSLNLVVGFLGELSLGHAGFMCVGAYVGTSVANVLLNNNVNVLLALVISIVVAAASAAVFGFIVGLPALRLRGDYLAIVTLAFGEIVRNIFRNLPFFGGAQGLPSMIYQYNVNNRKTAIPVFIPTFICLFVMLIVAQNLIRSKHGRAITAIRDNEVAAKSMGINATGYKLAVFMISAAFAGVAGAIYGATVSPVEDKTFIYNYSIEILVMVVLGGMGSITGSIVSATLITVINSWLKTNLPGDLAAVKTLIYAMILILLIILKNAPALKSLREKYNLKAFLHRLMMKKRGAGYAGDDDARWDVVPTKIDMDEVLSTDLVVTESTMKPDKEEKP